MSRPIASNPQSIRQHLLNRARARGENHQLLLTRYGFERFLFRLGRSRWADRFIVKGATLFDIWLERPHRSTQDLDFSQVLAVGSEELEAQLREICAIDASEDGVVFDFSRLSIRPIRGAQEGRGLRARFHTQLGSASTPLQIDVGFGDAITPAPRFEEVPTILDLPAPAVWTYPKETFVAEKFEAMVRYDDRNTRYKDFSDVAQLSLSMAFEGAVLLDACRATFTHRETAVSSDRRPPPLGPRFYLQAGRSDQWNELARENPALGGLGSFREVGEQIISFLGPVWRALAENTAMDSAWEPPGPWPRDQHLDDP